MLTLLRVPLFLVHGERFALALTFVSLRGSASRAHNRAVVRAASAASKAADFLLGFLPPGIDSRVEGNEEAA
ncbi:hypothetical protein [Bradyrhizobium sp. LTSP849]|uniref:hypothetical protein n=1 Tax=Bradyrhizobium sp. LTSP849 TaxID=1615890 RepID=UPI001FD97132|nr:hypothetical protein [Bradyrhizobium sp. LTSP849]